MRIYVEKISNCHLVEATHFDKGEDMTSTKVACHSASEICKAVLVALGIVSEWDLVALDVTNPDGDCRRM